ncbi:MAG: hypothetical protein WCV86_04730 [Patescibacteria group bacterium]|jgi:heat-inducible transcriptional repressor
MTQDIQLSERQEDLLKLIVEAFIDEAEPVSSKYLVEVHGLSWSPATIRNDMAFLEQTGFITHPHTSAGRIPTEFGWKYYLKQQRVAPLDAKEASALKRAAGQTKDATQRTKELAKSLADISQQTVIVGFAPHDVYYTGIANLVRHPEFQSMDVLSEMTGIVDHCDDVISRLFQSLQPEPQILLGSENPFGAAAGTIVSRWGKKPHGIFCLLGPIRMNYPKNIARISFIQHLLT